MPRSIEDTDRNVRTTGQLRRIAPSPWKTVRVEDYDSDFHGRSGIFIWDPNMPAPVPETGALFRSVVDGYGVGEASEGAWSLLREVPPDQDDLVVAVPDSGIVRPFVPWEHATTIAAIDTAVAYVDGQGGGVVRIPHVLDYDPTSITQAGGVSLTTPTVDAVRRATGSIETSGPGLYVIDTDGGTRTLTIRSEEHKPGLMVEVKRQGSYYLDVESEEGSTFEGQAGPTRMTEDGTALSFRYELSADNWTIV